MAGDSPAAAIVSARVDLQSNATLSATGSEVTSDLGYSDFRLLINLKNAPTGTSPTIQFKIEEVDPIDQTTVIGQTVTGVSHTAAGYEALELAGALSDTFKITWTIGGTTPEWTGVNVSFLGHNSGSTIEPGDRVTVSDDPTTPTVKRMAVQTIGTVSISSASAATDLVEEYLEDGGSKDLLVNGSGTPVVFTVLADPTDDIIITELRFVMSSQSLDWDGTSFGKGSALSNGILVQTQLDEAVSPTTLATLQINENFLEFATSAGINVAQLPATGSVALVASFQFNGTERLVAGSSDFLKATIQDNLTVGALGLNYLVGVVYGYKEVTA
jgi:hypothetical protein